MREFFWRLRAMFRRDGIGAELEHHLELETQAGIERGLEPAEARRQAVLRAGNLTGAQESLREARGVPLFDGLAADLRHAARSLRRSPSFAAVAVAALAAAVAINTLVFFLLDGILLRPLPYPDPARLIRVYEAGPRVTKWPLSIANYEEFRRSAKSLESMALYTGFDLELNKERIPGIAVTPEFFSILGATPFAGRFFERSEMTRSARPVVISHTIWRTHFHSDPAIAGRAIRMNRETWTIIGVAPPGFQHVGGEYRSPLQGDTVGLWIPLALDGSEMRRRASHFSNAVARLRPGYTAESARLELCAIASRIAKEDPRFSEGLQANTAPLLDEVAGRSKQVVFLLAVAGLIVMIIACANVAGLCVARAIARGREFDIRHALGAGRWQLLRAGLAENLVLGAAGAILGLLFATAVLPVLRTLLPADFPRLHEIRLTPLAAAFSVFAGLATALAAGLIPRVRRPTMHARAWLVGAEVALAVLLCAGGLLLGKSYELLGERDHGFTPNGVQSFQISFPGPEYRDSEKLSRVSRELR
ncbi:MAG: FtsX-like permease family protein [Acidobacteria bacterium]|nr:FtsX-like permease family protein [Acidobacteriota bacterium]